MIKFLTEKNIFISTLINQKSYLGGFGTKFLGDSRKIATILTFLKKYDIDFKKIILAEQIHSANISFIANQSFNFEIEKVEDVDGLVTAEKGVLLTIRTADCLPVIYADKKNGIIGITHNGWRGSIKKISQKMVAKMISLGAKIERIKVALGPAIGVCCYKINEDRYWQFKADFDGYSDKIFFYRGGWYLNLIRLNYLLLQESGIKKENIDYFPFCTYCDKKRFYSFRRDKKENYGEMFNFIIRY